VGRVGELNKNCVSEHRRKLKKFIANQKTSTMKVGHIMLLSLPIETKCINILLTYLL